MSATRNNAADKLQSSIGSVPDSVARPFGKLEDEINQQSSQLVIINETLKGVIRVYPVMGK